MSFFGPSRKYLVVGASINPAKFGYKVLDWYISHNLNVIPINPKSEYILDVKTVPTAIEALKQGSDFSMSFITPPHVTSSIIEELIDSNINKNGIIKGIWFQPGSFNSEIVERVKNALKVATVVDDDCILVSGEYFLDKAKL